MRLRASARAFSLIEILIALTILMIAMAGIMAAFASAINLHRRGADQTTAALLAESVLEGIQAYALEGKSADEISTKSGAQYVFRESTQYPGHEYRITCVELSAHEYHASVEVRVRPTTERPGTTNVDFDTILLRR